MFDFLTALYLLKTFLTAIRRIKKSACWRSEQPKGVLGKFFDRIKALKSKRQLLKRNSKPHTSFEAVDWAKKTS